MFKLENDPNADPNAGAASGATVEPTPTPDPVGEAGAAAVAAELEKPVEVEPVAEPPAPKDNREKRIAKLTAQLAKSRQTIEELRAGRSAGVQDLTPEEFNQKVEEVAAQRRSAEEFNRRSNEAAEAGRKEFGESQFKERIDSLATLVDPTDRASQDRYVRFIQTALETGKAHAVCFALGADLDRAEEILNMGPAQQAIALERLAQGTAPKVSAAPKPITPVGAKGPAHTAVSADDKDRADNLSTAEWMRRREAQIAERGKRR